MSRLYRDSAYGIQIAQKPTAAQQVFVINLAQIVSGLTNHTFQILEENK